MKWDDYGEFIKIDDYVQHQIEFPTEAQKLTERGDYATKEQNNINSNVESGLFFIFKTD